MKISGGRQGVVALLFATALAGACASIGPARVMDQRRGYADVIVRSANEQLLSNIVRVRYRETPSVLDLTQVVSQFSTEAYAEAGFSFKSGSDGFYQVPLDVGGKYSSTPTVTYSPVVGKQFALRMLSPIELSNVLLLARAGWDLRRLMVAAVREINNVQGYPISVGHHAKPPQTLGKFGRIVTLLEKLEIEQAAYTVWGPDKKPYLEFAIVEPGSPMAHAQDELRDLLSLDRTLRRYRFARGPALPPHPHQEISLTTRSVVEVMLFLAEGMDTTAGDHPPTTTAARGTVSTAAASSIFRIRTSQEAPEDAFVSVQRNGKWFYVTDDDWNSKTTFALVSYLFMLQFAATEGASEGVLLTIPAG